MQQYVDLDTEKLKQELMARWRFPTLSVHKIDVSISNRTIIPRCAKAIVSMRIVPNQAIEDIAAKFEDYVRQVFADMGSENEISVRIEKESYTRRSLANMYISGRNPKFRRVLVG